LSRLARRWMSWMDRDGSLAVGVRVEGGLPGVMLRHEGRRHP
jgi:hypothetical protein